MEELVSFFEAITVLVIVKWLVWVLMTVYCVFAFLMMKQTKAMTRAVSMKDDYLIRMLSTVHFVAATAVLLLSLLIM